MSEDTTPTIDDLEALRASHAQELAALRKENAASLQDKDRELREARQAHERAFEEQDAAHQRALQAKDQAHATAVDALRQEATREIQAREAAIAELQAQLADLQQRFDAKPGWLGVAMGAAAGAGGTALIGKK